jgi:hypothetical protein
MHFHTTFCRDGDGVVFLKLLFNKKNNLCIIFSNDLILRTNEALSHKNDWTVKPPLLGPESVLLSSFFSNSKYTSVAKSQLNSPSPYKNILPHQSGVLPETAS